MDQLLQGNDAQALFSKDGLIDQLKKRLAERGLNAEIDHHLDQANEAGNHRNGYSRKTVATDTAKLEIEVPRDRRSTFEPQLIAKYQRRFPGFDEKIDRFHVRAGDDDARDPIAAPTVTNSEGSGAPHCFDTEFGRGWLGNFSLVLRVARTTPQRSLERLPPSLEQPQDSLQTREDRTHDTASKT